MLTRFGALSGAVLAVLRPCSARFPTCCAPAVLYRLGTPFQMELGTPCDWPFLGAWRYFPAPHHFP